MLVVLLVSGCGGKSGQFYLEAGITKVERQDFEAAAELLEKAAEKLPNNPTAYCNLGIAYWKLGQTEQAVESLTKAADLSEKDPRPLEFIGRIYSETRRWEEARSAFNLAYERSPLSPRIVTSIALAGFHAGKVKMAHSYLTQALDLDSNYPPALYNMGVLCRDRLKNRGKAVIYFQKYVKVTDDSRHAEIARQFLAQKPVVVAKKIEKKISDEKKVVSDSKPSLADLLVKAARAAIQNEEFDSALVMLNRAIKKDPANPDALWELAVLYDKHLNYQDSAARSYRKFKQLFPNDPLAAKAQEWLESMQ